MSYCSYEDVVGLGSEFSLPTGWTKTNVESLITDVEFEINDLLQDDYSTPTTETFICDGENTSLMQMGRYTKKPIISISSITWRESTAEDWDSTNNWDSSDFYADKYFIEATGANVSARYSTRDKFVKGTRNYRIIGSFGHSSVPAQIKFLTVLMVRERLKPGYLNEMDLKSVSWSDYTVSFSNNKSSIQSYTGYPILDKIINRYRNKDSYLAVV